MTRTHGWMSARRFARMWHIGYLTMHYWRVRGIGPKPERVRGYWMYRISDVEDFIVERTVDAKN